MFYRMRHYYYFIKTGKRCTIEHDVVVLFDEVREDGGEKREINNVTVAIESTVDSSL